MSVRPRQSNEKDSLGGAGRESPRREDGWCVARVTIDIPGQVERMSDASPALISILAAMVTEAVAYERLEEATHGTKEESPGTDP
jgi:hypothetical protein